VAAWSPGWRIPCSYPCAMRRDQHLWEAVSEEWCAIRCPSFLNLGGVQFEQYIIPQNVQKNTCAFCSFTNSENELLSINSKSDLVKMLFRPKSMFYLSEHIIFSVSGGWLPCPCLTFTAPSPVSTTFRWHYYYSLIGFSLPTTRAAMRLLEPHDPLQLYEK
jgi:hypothetical protein